MTAWTRLVSLSLFFTCAWAQSPFQIHGYIQGRFTNQEGTSHRLEIRRARISASGTLFSKFSYVTQVDVAKRPHLLDLAAAWKFSRAVQVTGGQFKIPFSAESLISDNLNIPIARARVVNGLVPGRDTGVQGRDVGFQVSGTLGPVEYAAGVFRGQLLLQSPSAHYRATAGRVIVHPVKKLSIGGDWYVSPSAPAHAETQREEVEASYERGRLRFRSEQIWGRDGSVHRRGGYALAAWELSTHWEPLARADWLTSRAGRPDATSVAYLAGLNFRWGKYVKIGANTGAQRDQGPRGTSSLFLAQTLLSF